MRRLGWVGWLWLVGCGVSVPTLEVTSWPVTAPDAGGSVADGGSVTVPFGRVLVRDTSAAAGSHLNDVHAIFGVDDGCARERLGDCVVTRCADDAGFFPAGSDVGALTFSGFTFLGAPVPLRLERPPYRTSSARPRQLWDGGEPLTAESASFQLTTLAPTPMSLTPPSCTTLSCLATVSRQRALTAHWTPGALGKTVVTIALERYVVVPPSPNFELKQVGSIECEFPAGSTQGQVPLAVVSQLPTISDGGTDQSWISVSRRSSSSAVTDAGRVVFDAEWTALSDSCTWD